MPKPRSLTGWLRLPGRVALILGLGALPTAGVHADAPDQTNLGSFGDVLVRSEAGRIYLSEGGRETELRLSATPQRDHLLRLLEERGPVGVKLDPDPRVIMSGGGGSGFSLRDIAKSLTGEPTPAPQVPPQVTAPSRSPKREPVAPRDPSPATNKKG